ncbi:uncharacterized protein [Drosophila bipectinata]|uniref:uncharacterized protein isoform X2 n=1 Tax=Drosophila bipectinata TaxID=42026 RepID=UPI0038B2ADE5
MGRLMFFCLTVGCIVVFVSPWQMRNRFRNNACLVKNRYSVEKNCHGARRSFYSFHRVILDCIKVYSKCPRVHTRNDYSSLSSCRNDCQFHMKPPTDFPSTAKPEGGAPDDGAAPAPGPAPAPEGGAPAPEGGAPAPEGGADPPAGDPPAGGRRSGKSRKWGRSGKVQAKVKPKSPPKGLRTGKRVPKSQTKTKTYY